MSAQPVSSAGTGAAEVLAKQATVPRYLTIQRILEQRLVSGEYPAGSLMPTEIELAAEFKTSRFTVRSALRELSDRGFVERRQGIGTRVVTAYPRAQFIQSFQSLEELFQVAIETWFVTHEVTTVRLGDEEAARIGARAGAQWTRITGVRWTEPGGRPICFIQSFVPMRYAGALDNAHDHHGPFFSLLERHAEKPIDEVVQEVRAAAMPPEAARSLGLASGSLALQVLRRYSTVGGVLIASFNWHPADQMTYTMRIHRNRQSAEG
ncbi:MAG: GntR family transcriptional regulator [Pseudomonadota bacterium]